MINQLLSKVQRDTNLSELLRNSGIIYIGGIFTILFTLTQQLATAHLLGTADYGRFAAVISSATLIFLFVDVRTWELGTKQLARPIHDENQVEIRRIITWLIIIDVTVGLTGTLLLFLFAAPIAGFLLKLPEWAWLVRLYSVQVLFLTLGSGGLIAVARLYNQFSWLAGRSVLNAIIRLIFIGGAAFLGLQLPGVIIAALLAEFINMVVLLFISYRILKKNGLDRQFPDFNRPEQFVQSIKLMRDLWIGATLKGLHLEMFIPLTALLSTPTQVGLLKVGLDISDVITRLTAPLSVVVSPIIIKVHQRDATADLFRLVKQATLLLAAISVPIIILIILFGPLILPSLLDKENSAIQPIIIPLVLGVGLNALFMWLRPAVIAADLAQRQNWIGFLLMVSSMIALIVTIPVYGAVSSAVVLFFFFALYNSLSFIIFYQRVSHHE